MISVKNTNMLARMIAGGSGPLTHSAITGGPPIWAKPPRNPAMAPTPAETGTVGSER